MFIGLDRSGKKKLTAKDKQVLQQQVINEDEPGTILRDFEMMLDFIGLDGIEVSQTHHLLPLRALKPLNARLSHPVVLDLKRPQQKSYPPLNGLFLLVRASGLTYVETAGPKAHLRVDETVRTAWTKLNPTERYFTLLETWLLRANPEIIGERAFWGWLAGEWLEFFERIPEQGLEIEGNDRIRYALRYSPGVHYIVLAALFGLISLQAGPPESGGGWRLEKVNRTRFGEAVCHLLADYFLDSFDTFMEYNTASEIPFGELQPLLQPYFPEWQANLVIPETEFRDGLYVFKVSLGPRIWRQIALPGTDMLDSLSSAILKAYKFDFDHLYQFTYNNRFGISVSVNHPYMDEGPWASEMRIGDLPLKPGETMVFLYDFGDNWQFRVQLLRIDPADPKVKGPVLVEAHGEAPEQYEQWDE